MSLRLTVYETSLDGTRLSLPEPGWRFVYARDGSLDVETGAETVPLAADGGCFANDPGGIAGRGEAWIYELAPAGSLFLEGAEIILSHRLHPAFDGPFLMRADRIESRPGAQTPRHGHRGPGIRRLVFGRLLAEVGETVERIDAGDAWFETGHDPVVGTNIGGTNAAFVRVMLLPAELHGGKSSFVASDAAEAAKPRSVDNRLFGEVLLPDSVRG